MKNNPWYRIAATAGGVLIVAVLAGAYRMAESHGVFTPVKPGFAGSCRAVPSATGPEDIAIDAQEQNRLRLGDRPAGAQQGQAFAARTGFIPTPTPSPARSWSSLPARRRIFIRTASAFIARPDGSLTLMAINHRLDKTNTIDIFSVDFENGAVELTEVGSIGGGLLSARTISRRSMRTAFMSSTTIPAKPISAAGSTILWCCRAPTFSISTA